MDPSQWNNPSQYFAGAAAPPGQGPDDPNNRRQTSRAPLQHHNATRPGPPYPAGQGPYMRGPPLTPAEQAPYLASQPFHDNPYVYPGGQHVAPPPMAPPGYAGGPGMYLGGWSAYSQPPPQPFIAPPANVPPHTNPEQFATLFVHHGDGGIASSYMLPPGTLSRAPSSSSQLYSSNMPPSPEPAGPATVHGHNMGMGNLNAQGRPAYYLPQGSSAPTVQAPGFQAGSGPQANMAGHPLAGVHYGLSVPPHPGQLAQRGTSESTPSVQPIQAPSIRRVPPSQPPQPVQALPMRREPSSQSTQPVQASSVRREPSSQSTQPVQASSVRREPSSQSAQPVQAPPMRREPSSQSTQPVQASSVRREPSSQSAQPVQAPSIRRVPPSQPPQPVQAPPMRREPSSQFTQPVQASSVRREPSYKPLEREPSRPKPSSSRHEQRSQTHAPAGTTPPATSSSHDANRLGLLPPSQLQSSTPVHPSHAEPVPNRSPIPRWHVRAASAMVHPEDIPASASGASVAQVTSGMQSLGVSGRSQRTGGPSLGLSMRPSWIPEDRHGPLPQSPVPPRDCWTRQFKLGTVAYIPAVGDRFGPASQSSNSHMGSPQTSNARAPVPDENINTSVPANQQNAHGATLQLQAQPIRKPDEKGKLRPAFITWHLPGFAMVYAAPLLTSMLDPKKGQGKGKGQAQSLTARVERARRTELRNVPPSRKDWWLPVEWKWEGDPPAGSRPLPATPDHPNNVRPGTGDQLGPRPQIPILCRKWHREHRYTSSLIWAGDPGQYAVQIGQWEYLPDGKTSQYGPVSNIIPVPDQYL